MPFRVTVTNRAGMPIACAATLAHWFSADLGAVASSATRALELLVRPADGTVLWRNARGEPLPVEQIWCGVAGWAWATRSVVPWPRRAGARPADMRLVCRLDGDRLSCA